MPSLYPVRLAATVLALCVTMPVPPVAAQTLPYGNAGSSGSDGSGASDDAPARRSGGGRNYVQPYIEAAQVVQAQLSPGDDVLTYSRIAAGVDTGMVGRNAAASLSLRYERRIGWGKAEDGDTLSGLARGQVTVARGVRLETGALATRTQIDGGGSGLLGPVGDNDAVTQVYSVFAGPTVATRAGSVDINGHYRIGYSRIEQPNAIAVAPGQPAIDVFDDSIVQQAGVHAGVKPGVVAPIGIGVGANAYREDIANLDQRVTDLSARADVTLPVSPSVALVGGIGYEDVEVSARDALRDAAGNPVIGRGGKYRTDKSSPRIIAYDTSGLIWDAGVMWRPSRRTSAEAHFGRRYGGWTASGSISYAPNSRSSFGLAVYDGLAGFGGQMTRALAGLPEQFQAQRNPLSGDLRGCVASVNPTANGNTNCLAGALGSVRSSVFRGRGVQANYNMEIGRMQAGIGAGYDRRRFIAPRNTVLAMANGVVDENVWLAGYLNGRIDRVSNFTTSMYANWFQSGSAFDGDTTGYGASASYNRQLTNRLVATAALGVDGVTSDIALDDLWTASALLGLRYNF